MKHCLFLYFRQVSLFYLFDPDKFTKLWKDNIYRQQKKTLIIVFNRPGQTSSKRLKSNFLFYLSLVPSGNAEQARQKTNSIKIPNTPELLKIIKIFDLLRQPKKTKQNSLTRSKVSELTPLN